MFENILYACNNVIYMPSFNCVCAKLHVQFLICTCICNFVILVYMYVCNVYFCKVYESVMITNSQPHVRVIIVFMVVKYLCACNKLHYGKVMLVVI
jgi:hypothetical protein